MRRYSDQEITAYIATGDPFDKAGSYAIQHAAFHPVERIQGCFLAVVGLSLPLVQRLLREAGVAWPGIQAEVLENLCPGCPDYQKTKPGVVITTPG